MNVRLLYVVLLGLVAGCRSSAPVVSEPLRVFAASSLTEAFGDLEKAFEVAHAGVQVETTFGGSQALRTQIEQGADADVFASADETHVQALTNAKLASSPVVFAKNDLVIIVPENNPAQIATLADLPRASKIVIGAPNVPVGAYTRKVLKNATPKLGPTFEQDVLSRVVSEEANVRLVRSKVELGEVDAAIVYRTDVIASKQVKSIEIPTDINAVASYFVGSVTASKQPKLAQEWVELLSSADGQKLLTTRGFIGANP